MPHRARSLRIRAWDCETVEDRIVLFLTAGADQQPDYLYSPAGLETARIFDWMLSHANHRRLNIAFFFDYDVNQLLRQLPPAHLEQLRARGRVRWRRYRIRHVPSKRFTLEDVESGHSVTIWDVSGWAQCSFVRLCRDWQLGSEEDRQYVAGMKARRQDLSDVAGRELIRYTTLECALLCQWMEMLLELHKQVGLTLRAYSGAGSTAAAMLRRAGWRPPDVPEAVQAVAEAAFFGGRTETSCIGPVPEPVHGYDIRSAYPHAIRLLPEIAGAHWFHVERYVPNAWGFYRVRWSQPKQNAWGLFPMRGAPLPGGRRSLSLLYPITGAGWFHSWEVEAALAVRPESVEVLEGHVILQPAGRPFAWIEEVAAERLRRKLAGDAAQFPLKVGLNSLYGKMAQHTGSHPYQSMVYASAITAHTRATLLPHLLEHQHDILLAATDGILARRPLDVPVGDALGEWEFSIYPHAWILQAGVYWAGAKIRTRGIDGRQLDVTAVDAAWRRLGQRASVQVTTRRVLSYRAACARGAPEATGSWDETVRTIRFSPAPRRRAWRRDQHGALLTLPAHVDEYQIQAALDAVLMDETLIREYDEEDQVLPDWMLDDE